MVIFTRQQYPRRSILKMRFENKNEIIFYLICKVYFALRFFLFLFFLNFKQDGSTPLLHETDLSEPDFDILKMLVDLGADVNAQDKVSYILCLYQPPLLVLYNTRDCVMRNFEMFFLGF